MNIGDEIQGISTAFSDCANMRANQLTKRIKGVIIKEYRYFYLVQSENYKTCLNKYDVNSKEVLL